MAELWPQQELDLKALAAEEEEAGLAEQLPPLLDVVQSRAMLQALGVRPPRHMVDEAQASLARIDNDLSRQLDAIAFAPIPAGVEASSWNVEQAVNESNLREAAEREKLPYKSIIQVEELHCTYEAMVKRAEAALLCQCNPPRRPNDIPERPQEASDLDDALLSELQQAFINRTQELDLSCRTLEHVPESFGRIYTLVILDLSSNQLEVVPDAIAGLPNLSTLKINSNQLKSLPDSIGLLQNLKVLDVSGNQLATLPESISRCRALVELYANFNQMVFLPAKFGYTLENLEKLSLHYNSLSVLPNSICELKALKYLDVHFNKLRGLPEALGHLIGLQVLNVSSNFSDLTSVPDSIGDLVNLTDFDLSFNQIRELPASIGRLDKLVTLKLEGNPLVDPPLDVVSHSHEAVMEYLVLKWNNSVMEVQESSVTATCRTPDNGWFPGLSGKSWMGDWVGNIQDYMLGSSPKSFGRNSRRPEDYFEQL